MKEEIVKKNNKIVSYSTIKKATKIGSGCHILLPRELLGRNVRVIYKEEKN